MLDALKEYFQAEGPPARDWSTYSPEDLKIVREQYEETVKSTRRVFHTLVAACLFCAIMLSVPDANLVLADVPLEIPLLSYQVAFAAFLIIGPILIAGLTLYLHLFVASLSAFRGYMSPAKVPALFTMEGRTARVITWLLFYWMPPAILIYAVWRTLPLASTARVTSLVALVVTVVLLFLQIRRCPRQLRKLGGPVLAVLCVGVLTALAFSLLGDHPPLIRRELDLFNALMEKRDLRYAALRGAFAREARLAGSDLHGADLTGADLTSANLSGANLRKAELADCLLQDADLTGATFDPDELQAASAWVLAKFDDEDRATLRRLAPESLPTPEQREVRNLSSLALRNMSFRGADLSGFNLAGADLSGSTLTDALLNGANLQGADLSETEFRPAQIRDARNWFLAHYGQTKNAPDPRIDQKHEARLKKRDLESADLQGLDLRGAVLDEFDLSGANLTGVDLRQATLSNANLDGADLREARLTADQVRSTNNWILAYFDRRMGQDLGLSSAHVERLRKQDLSTFDFPGVGVVMMRSAHLAGFDLHQVNLSHVDLEGSDLSNADLRGARLAGSNLLGVRFAEATLDQASLLDANLRRADLRSSKLRGADLRGADLSQVNLSDADLSHADLRGVLGLTCVQMRLARGWASAVRDSELTCGSVAAEPRRSLEEVRPHLTLGLLGAEGNGMSAVAAAISHLQSEHRSVFSLRPESRDKPAASYRRRGLVLAVENLEFDTPTRRYSLLHASTHSDLVKGLISGELDLEGAILVVSAADGAMPQTREHVSLARQVGVPAIVVFMNECEMVDDEELLELVELEIRELLSSYDFPGDDVPVVRGSVLKSGDPESKWGKSLMALMAAVDRYIPLPERAIDQPFLMPIEDIFSISGRGTVITGRVERGVVKVGEEVEIIGIHPTTKTLVTGVEMFRKQLDQGQAGDNIGALLQGTKKDEAERGQVLAKPGSITPHTRFRGEVYILTRDEGGRHTPFFNGYRPQFYFRTTDVTGVAHLLEGTEMVMPGDNVNLSVELIAPIAMEKGMHFAIRERGRTVGVGVVTETLP